MEQLYSLIFLVMVGEWVEVLAWVKHKNNGLYLVGKWTGKQRLVFVTVECLNVCNEYNLSLIWVYNPIIWKIIIIVGVG